MMIRDKDDLKLAYVILRMCPNSDRLPDLKRDIREYLKRDDNPDRYMVKGDWDFYILLITLPEFIESAEEANEWFMAEEYIEPYYTYYDCTGRPFTCWYKIFQRNGRWMAYHRVNADV